MSFFNSLWSGIKSAGGAINTGLKKTKLISTLAPIAGMALGKPGIGTAIGSVAGAAGYGKGGKVGRVLRAPAMAKGGKVKKAKQHKAKAHKKAHKKK